MSVFTLLVVVLVIGVVAFAISKAPFISPAFKNIAFIICLVVCALLVLDAFGVIDSLRGVKVPRVGK